MRFGYPLKQFDFLLDLLSVFFPLVLCQVDDFARDDGCRLIFDPAVSGEQHLTKTPFADLIVEEIVSDFLGVLS